LPLVGIDAVALLRIARLKAPRTRFGAELPVQHRKDATLLHTLDRFDGVGADERAWSLRQLLGPELDRHDDPRGILVFPDLCEPKARSYEALVAEIADAGVWAPRVSADHVPARFNAAEPGSHDALVADMIKKLGHDTATQLDLMAQVQLMVRHSTGGRADAVEGYAEAIAQVTAAMGKPFSERYERSLGTQANAAFAAEKAHAASIQAMQERVMNTSPVTDFDFDALLEGLKKP
jgi:hypothetical protein